MYVCMYIYISLSLSLSLSIYIYIYARSTACPSVWEFNSLAAWSTSSTGVVIYKLQALVYGSLPQTTDITDYAIGLEKLSANSFSLVLKWHLVCSRQLKLYQAFLL